MCEQALAEKFNTQLTRACRPFPKKAEAFQRFIEMHKRHGELVKKVIEGQFRLHADRFFRGDLPPSSLRPGWGDRPILPLSGNGMLTG